MRLALIGATALTLAGCALVKAPEPEVPPAPGEAETAREPDAEPTREPAKDLERLLAYFQRIRRLPTPELSRENDSARVAFSRSRSDFDRLRLAMVLSLPNTAFNDDARSLDLLDPVAKNQNAPLHGLALLMSVFVQEQRRLGQSAQAVQQKLDALKSMERSLIEREQAGQKRR
jgi:hypothetical protein